MTPAVLAILVAVVGVPLNWFVVWRLWRLWKETGNYVIRERGIMATALAVTVTIFALVFLNNDLTQPVLSGDVTKWVTRAVLLVAAIVPPVYWIWLFR